MTTIPEAALDRNAVVAGVVKAVTSVLNKDTVSVGEQTRLMEDLGLDSTNVLELLMNLEDQLEIMIDSDTLEQRHFETIGTLSDYILEQS